MLTCMGQISTQKKGDWGAATTNDCIIKRKHHKIKMLNNIYVSVSLIHFIKKLKLQETSSGWLVHIHNHEMTASGDH